MPDEEIDRPVKKINPVYSKMCCSFTTFFFSRIGLCLIVIAYSIGGGFIFKSIESPIERHDLAKVQQSLDAVVQQLLTQSNKYLVLIERNWTAMAREEILKYQDGIIRAVKQRGYLGSKHEFEMSGRRGSKSTTMNEQWNTAGAVLYAVTVITSIGYGNITCKTTAGRVLTIFYASCGIPLFLIFLANIGSTMADSFRFIYSRICCAYCRMVSQRRRRRWMQRSFADAQRQYPSAAYNVPLSAFESSDERPHDVQTVSVPISVTMLLLIGYIFVGAFLFSQWENWSLLDGFYFSFITLTTIGLGDFVPGRSLSPITNSETVDGVNDVDEINTKSAVEGKLVLCAIYLMIGLSLLVMCFNLVEEEVRAKCRRVGIQLGIYDDDDISRMMNIKTTIGMDTYYAV